MNILYAILLILISFSYLCSNPLKRWFDYTREGKGVFKVLNCSKDFFLEKLQFQSDIPFSSQDFLSITGLHENQQTTPLLLERACFYLQQSKRFASVRFSMRDGERGKVVLFDLKARWLFAHLAIEGVWLGKDELKNLYLLNLGEPFDISKHHASLKRYRSYFKKRGYLSVVVKDVLNRSEKEKKVNVRINIHKGRRFSIKEVALILKGSFPGLEELQRVLGQYAEKRLKHRIYKSAVVNEVAQALKYLLLQKGFPLLTINMNEVRLSHSSIRLELVIEVAPRSKFVITGNEKFSYEQLISHIAHDQTLLWHLSTPFLINTVRQWYRQHGFLQSSVQVEHTDDGWSINLYEGPRIKIKDILFEGVKAFDHNELVKIFRSLCGKDYADDDELSKSIDTLLDFYAQQGFWKAEVDEKNFVPVDSDYSLQLVIDEGRRRWLRSLVVDTDLSFMEKKELEKRLINNSLPCPFDIHFFDLHKAEIVAFLKEKKIDADIQPIFDDEAYEIDLIWEIKKRASKAFFGNTIITGVPELSRQKIMRELAYEIGEPWQRKRLDQTFHRLRDLNIFESIRIYPLTTHDPVGQRPVIVDLIADDPLELQARIGFIGGNKSRVNTYKVGGSILYKNITRHADTFSMDADLTRFWRDIEFHYRYPHINGLPLSADVRLFSKKYDQLCYTGCRAKLYTISEIGGGLNFHARYRSCVADITGGFETIKITDLFVKGAEAIYFSPSLIGYREPYIFVEPQLSLEYVDNAMNPTKGLISRICTKMMFPLDSRTSRSIRLLLEQSFFVPFHKKLVGALRARVGHIFTTSFYRLLPSERFYLGGPCTVRSYQQDFAPPVAYYYEDGVKQWVPQGTCTMGGLNIELRSFITQNLGGVLFYDVGFLNNELKNQFCWSHGAGFGIRYLTPIGPLRFDIGWKGKYYPADCSSLAWFLTIGHAF